MFPKYILDPNCGIQPGRARGPFASAVNNGVGLYVCAVAAATRADQLEEERCALIAASVGGLCLLGTLLTWERSVWLGAVLATVAAIAFLPEGRRMFLRIVPAIADRASRWQWSRSPALARISAQRYGDQNTIWVRQNLNRAALNMVEARPMFGFGWGEFEPKGPTTSSKAPTTR